jgi:uncharacterized iron-regulated protein
MNKKHFIFLALVFFSQNAFSALLDGSSLEPVQLGDIMSKVQPGSILIVGEFHENQDHHDNQFEIVEALQSLYGKSRIHLGLEFLNYTDQWHIHQYLSDSIDEDTFLKKVEWSDPSTYRFYRPSVASVKEAGGLVIGLNIPRPLTSSVAQGGIESLGGSARNLLPSPLNRGNENYFERFYNAVGGSHFPEELLENYFWAQSIWDDVISDVSIKFMKRNPHDILVIFIGDFHVMYGGGLPELLKRKGHDKVYSLSQTVTGDDIAPKEKYGTRADWIWVTPNNGELGTIQSGPLKYRLQK